MPTVLTNSINFSTKNASSFVDSIEDKERILSFYLGGVLEGTGTRYSEDARNDSFKNASFFQRINPQDVELVAKQVNWSNSSFNTYDTSDDNTEGYYVLNDNKVYLVIGNNKYNTKDNYGTVIASDPPTHTSGIVKYSDGYEYLYLFGLSAQGKITTTSNLWIPVPQMETPYYKGKLLYKKIDTAAIQNIFISQKEPVIPILSDTGSGAKIRLNTQITTAPTVTTSNKKYKIIGIEVVDIGNTPYRNFNLTDSLQAVLGKESASDIAEIASAIELGFSSNDKWSNGQILHCRHALINISANSSDIRSVIEQNKFTKFGIVENIENTSDQQIFTSVNSTDIVSNTVKLTISSYGSSGDPTTDDFLVGSSIVHQTKTKVTDGVVSFSKTSGSDVVAEIETVDKTQYEVSDRIKTSTNKIFEITSVTVPTVKQFSGNILHIGEIDFSYTDSDETGVKTFVTQVVQNF